MTEQESPVGRKFIDSNGNERVKTPFGFNAFTTAQGAKLSAWYYGRQGSERFIWRLPDGSFDCTAVPDPIMPGYPAERVGQFTVGEVKAGQRWADNDPRSAGRTLRVDRIDGEHAVCTVLTDADSFNRPTGTNTTVGKVTRISLKRFRPTSTGYRYVGEYTEEAGT